VLECVLHRNAGAIDRLFFTPSRQVLLEGLLIPFELRKKGKQPVQSAAGISAGVKRIEMN